MKLTEQIRKMHRMMNLNESRVPSILEPLIPSLVTAAQKVYDEWDQNEEGFDEMLGYGGVCQDIAEAMQDVLLNNGIECSTVSQQSGEQHVYVVAQIEDEGVFQVDISPYTYERGGGYNWKKIPDVVFDPSDIIIYCISRDPDDFHQFLDY